MSQGKFLERLQRKIRLLVTRAILTARIPRQTRRLIVFLSPGHEFRTGGVMAIALMCQETLSLQEVHGAQVVMCTVPGDPPLLRYSWFDNSHYMLDLGSVLRRCNELEHLMLHIPDYLVNQVLDWLNSSSQTLLRNVPQIHFNVLVFNIDLIGGQDIAGLTRFGKVTCTTGHEAYSNSDTRVALGVPLHKLVICSGSEFYSRSSYQEKEPLLVVSPDAHPLRESVLRQISSSLPDLQIKVIQDLSYEDYKKLIRRARWSLTFGEGLDGFFSEPTFSGTISFAVYNQRFFTPPFAELENVYPSWEILLQRIVSDLRRLDNPGEYRRCWTRAYDLLSQHLDTDRFRDNLRKFYRGEYTFP